MDLSNQVCLFSWLAGCLLPDENFNAERYALTFQPRFFLSYLPCLQAPLTYNLLYHFQLPWPYLRVTRSAQCGTFGFIFSYIFQVIRMKCDMVLKQFKLDILILSWVRFFWIKGKKLLSYWQCPDALTLTCIQIFINQFAANFLWW